MRTWPCNDSSNVGSLYLDHSGLGHSGTSLSTNNFYCHAHSWRLESLRGSNRNQRVEHLRCRMCGERQTRVWLGAPNQKRPDRVYRA